MIHELRKLVYTKGKEKIGEITGYYKYRVFAELKVIKQLQIVSGILCIEKMVSIAEKENIPFIINQEEVKGSLVCYLLGISETDPVKTGLRFNLTEDFRDRGMFVMEDFTKPIFSKEFSTPEGELMLQIEPATDNR